MAYGITRIDDAVLHVTISGVMKLSDQQSLQTAGMELIAKGRKLRLLVTLVDFQGWEKGVDWGDVGFMIAHGDDIAKMAFVGDERWKDQVFAFVGKGFRTTEIEFFPSASMTAAESWIHA
ncbi:MAG: STAS/SEC14 domain-containing protein [Deltaproteobacteria bacterium]|jgi:hypothetical protein|nr:STAS/SEC14 domain-containing protein [Deltaproteobacteria bacterium]